MQITHTHLRFLLSLNKYLMGSVGLVGRTRIKCFILIVGDVNKVGEQNCKADGNDELRKVMVEHRLIQLKITPKIDPDVAMGIVIRIRL